MPQRTQSLDAEQAQFDQDVADIKAWWKTPRQAHLKRPYAAERIAAMRNTVKQHYASSDQALKLWGQLNEHLKNGTYEMTFGATDPIMVSQMVKHQQTVYVSGAICGLSEVSHLGMDHADYPWDTVPKTVDRIFRSQMWHDQRQHHFRMLHKKEHRDKLENWDYLAPIVADGDMGFGGLTSTMKLAKAFVEAGVAMFHIDDLAIGLKKFTAGQGRTIVPTSEYLSRLTAARMQFDIMGAETMLLCRCDTDHSEFITSVIDPRDHKYVIGATVDIKPLAQVLEKAAESGKANLNTVRSDWMKSAGLATFDEAVKIEATEDQYQSYMTEISDRTVSLAERRAIAKKALSKDVKFDWELPRSKEGQYLFKSCVTAVIERALLAAPLGDVTWARMDAPVWTDILEFHTEVRKVYPNRLFAFGYTGNYPFASKGFSPAEISSFPSDLAKLGIVWQTQPIWAAQGVNLLTNGFAKMWREEGIEGYIREVQEPAMATEPMTDGFEKLSWCGAYLADAFLETVAARDGEEGGVDVRIAGDGVLGVNRKR
ncbi:MAG: hypothetical protein M1834_006901 [Cirrosporium novae-zelandiae]|nr:MAG: hypothetical protein M1834_006901 [Cirrosporium novae-zelandiae]